MELGLGFDDSDFERKQKATAGTKTSYNAKICGHLWFEEEEERDPNTYLHQQKFSADYHFYKGKYDIATTKYRALLDRIPDSNLPLRQDVEESLCRSLSHLGRHQESTDIAYSMVQTMRSEDAARQRQSLILLSQACRDAKDWAGCVRALEELVSGQSHYAHFWWDLARAYQHHRDGQACRHRSDQGCQHGDEGRSDQACHRLGCHHGDQDCHHGDQGLGDTPDPYLVISLTCFARARILLESVQNTMVQATRDRNQASICKINEEMKDLGASQELINQAIDVMRADLEHSSTGGEDGEENSEAATAAAAAEFSSEAFKKRWFSWIDKYHEKT